VTRREEIAALSGLRERLNGRRQRTLLPKRPGEVHRPPLARAPACSDQEDHRLNHQNHLEREPVPALGGVSAEAVVPRGK